MNNVTTTYTPTQWDTVEDKEKFEKQFKAFVSSGFKRSKFPKWFYTRLSMCFGMIAHYDQNGFYETWFQDNRMKERFIERCSTHGCYGDPAWTYSDVELVLQNWLIENDIIFKIDD